MAFKKITVDQFEKCMEETLLAYARETDENVVKSVQEVAKETVQDVKDAITAAGIGGTEYKNSIEYRNERGRMKGKSIIWSPAHYRLTHLLENGHHLVYFGRDTNKRTRAFPHWAKAEAIAVKKLEGRITKVVSE